MTTTKKTPKAGTQATTEKDTADLSIDLSTYCEAMKLAKAEGMETEDWIEQLIQKNASKPAPNVTKKREEPLFESAIHDGKLPVYLEADTVKFLREVCEAGTITAEDFTDAIIGDMVKSYLDGHDSAGDFILDLWIIADRPAAEKAMQAVADRWKAKQAAKA